MGNSDTGRRRKPRLWIDAQIIWTTLRVRRLVRRNDLRTALARCRRAERHATPAPAQEEVVRVSRAVRKIVGRLPGDSSPVVSSLVLIAVLARRGVDTSLVIGVRDGADLAPQAWVEVGESAAPVRSKFAQLVAL